MLFVQNCFPILEAKLLKIAQELRRMFSFSVNIVIPIFSLFSGGAVVMRIMIS